jgi:type II secretory pathway pseudopilin PulG
MKSALGPFVIAIVLALAGSVAWLAGRTETQLADVHKQLAVLQYAEAQTEGSALEQSQSLSLERRVPVVGKVAQTDARNTRAVAGYWRTDYAAIAPQHDANGVITETDPAILLLNANAAFRASQASGDRLDTVRRLDTVVKNYAEVLKAPACGAGDRDCDGRATDAAFNYEYAIRTRDQLAKQRGPAGKAAKTVAKADESDLPAGPTLHGKPGAPPPAVDMNQFKIVIPKRGEERKDAPDAGKGGQKIRKG